MKKYVSLTAGILLQVALGGFLAFSSYVPSFQEQWRFSSTQTQSVFGLTIFTFTLSMIFTGKLLVRKGPPFLIVLSGLLFMSGHWGASLCGGNFTLFLFSYIFLIAPALAFGYVSPISAGLLWFPRNRGLVTGFSVAGFGMGGVVLSTVVESLLGMGWNIELILKFIGFIWGGIIIICGLVSSTPPGMIHDKDKQKEIPPIKEHFREFTGVTLFLVFGTLPGLMLIGTLKPFGLFNGVSSVTAAVGVAVLSVGNGTGRITWGIIADKIHPRRLALVNMSGVLLSVILLMAVKGNSLLYIPAGFLLGFCYGGPLVIVPDQISRIFGPANLSRVYPVSMVFHGLAGAVGSSAAGALFQFSHSYFPVLLIAGIGTLTGLTGYFFLISSAAINPT